MIEPTILTEPPLPSSVRGKLQHRLRHMRRRLRHLLWRRRTAASRMEGPLVVKNNLLKGLDRIGQPYRLNQRSSHVTPSVGVLSNIGALRWAIAAKRRRRIEWLVAGPNLVVLPDEEHGILTAPEVDCIVTPSSWVSRLYESVYPSLVGRVVEWAVGVDQDFWCPGERSANHGKDAVDFLVYSKIPESRHLSLVEGITTELERIGLSYRVLNYGEYAPAQYRSMLQKSRAMVFLSESESQGIALFEAWACDVPTLVWDRERWEMGNRGFRASSAPYLTPACGLRFKDAAGFSERLREFLEVLPSFSPRRMILGSFTLELSARAYLRCFRTDGA